LKEQTVLRLYRDKKISTGTGAKMLGMPLYDFIRFLGEHQVSIFDYTSEELEREFQAVADLRKQLKAKAKRKPR
jgi:predicted HTH domain antitoxin